MSSPISSNPNNTKATTDSKAKHAKEAIDSQTHKVDQTKTKTYSVRKGDTFNSIARPLSITGKELAALNKYDDPNTLKVGDSIKLPDIK